jgi:hypothetical protein
MADAKLNPQAETLRIECGPQIADRLVLHHAYAASLQTAHSRGMGWSFEFRLYSEPARGRYPVTIGYRPDHIGHSEGTPIAPSTPKERPNA